MPSGRDEASLIEANRDSDVFREYDSHFWRTDYANKIAIAARLNLPPNVVGAFDVRARSNLRIDDARSRIIEC